MPSPPTVERLTSSVLSAVALRELVPDWPEPIIDEWLNFIENFIALANVIDIEIDQKIEEIATDFLDGSVPFAESGHLVADINRIFWDISANIFKIGGIIQSSGRIKGNVYVTPAMSPYSIQFEDEVITCDTDVADITLLLPEGTAGEPHKITNVGSLNNVANLTPFGIEELEGDNSTLQIHDTETLDIAYDDNTGWWA